MTWTRWARRLGTVLHRATDTLKLRVVVVAVLSGWLASAVSVFFILQASEHEALGSAGRQQAQEVQLQAALLDARLQHVEALLLQLGQEVNLERLQRPASLPMAWAQQRQAFPVFDFLDLARADGVPVLRHAQAPALPQSLDNAVEQVRLQALADGLAHVWGPVGRWPEEKPLVLLAQPLKNGAGQIQAVLVGGVSLYSSHLLPPQITRPSLAGMSVMVFNAQGVLLSHPSPSRLLGRAHDEPGLAELLQRWSQQGGGVAPEALSQLDARHLSSLAGLSVAPWAVARVTPLQQALAPYREVGHWAWWLTAGVALVCAALSGWLILWLTGPISQVLQRMHQVLDHSVPAKSHWPQVGGELGELVSMLRQVAMAQEREQQSLRVMVGQLEAILEHASVGIVVTRHRTLELLSHRASAMMGYAPGELHGQPARVLYPSDAAYEELGRQVREQFGSQGFFDGELVFRRKDGHDFWVHMLGRGVVPGDPEGGTIWIFDDITAEREARRALSWSASHDSLTGLVNRRELEHRLQLQLQHLAQAGPVPPSRDEAAESGGCVLFVDLDHFKAVNDQAGHAAGDQVLRQVARTMEGLVRQTDTVGRLGGDEFALLLPGCTLERASQIAEALRSHIEALPIELSVNLPSDPPINPGTQAHAIGCSIGLIELGPQHQNVAAVLHAADMACYQAKRSGRNQVVITRAAQPVVSG